MKAFFLKAAKIEYEEAIAYYDRQRLDLGKEFSEEIEKTIERISTDPTSWEKVTKTIHRCRTRKFPYGLLYEVHEENIIIIAVMHLCRKPGYWKDRLSEKQ